jgi:hypothetical protein
MSYQRDIFDLVARLSGTGNILAVPRMFCEMTGSLESGVLLSQIIYWADKGSDPDGWFYKSYAEWYQDSFLSEYQVRKGVKAFEKAGLLETKLKKVQGSPTLHYRIKKREFSEWILKNLGFETVKPKDELPNPQCPSIYTETTAETTSREGGGENPVPRSGESIPSTTPQPAPAYLATPLIAVAEKVAEATSYDRPAAAVVAKTPPRLQPRKMLQKDGQYFKQGDVVGDHFPAGKGTNAIQIYFERFSPYEYKLTEPQQYDMVTKVKDLDLWRAAVTAWDNAGFKGTNRKGIFDYYDDPARFRDRPTTYANGTQRVPAKPATAADLTFKQWLLKQYHSDVVAAIIRGTSKTEKDLRNEYEQWITGLGRPTNAVHPGQPGQ